eukprot:6180982-Pleurochrysis_carterae.AAC.2
MHQDESRPEQTLWSVAGSWTLTHYPAMHGIGAHIYLGTQRGTSIRICRQRLKEQQSARSRAQADGSKGRRSTELDVGESAIAAVCARCR